MAERVVPPMTAEEALRKIGEVADQMFWAEREVLRLRIAERAEVIIRATGPFGIEQIERLIRLLQMQRDIMVEAAAEART